MTALASVYDPHRGLHIKFGRRRPTVVHPHLKLANFLPGKLPPFPATMDYSPAAISALRQMYLNNTLGDCVPAWLYHYLGLLTGNGGGHPFIATDDQIISAYSAMSGYVRGDPSTDNGTDIQTALAYCVQNGLADGVKWSGYVAIDGANWQQLQYAIWLLEGATFGMELPDSYVNPFPSGDDFEWGTGTPNPTQGHCFGPVGYDTKRARIATWGLLGWQTADGIAQLTSSNSGGEIFIALTPEIIIRSATKAPDGLDWSGLIAAFDGLGGSIPTPVPSPGPPPNPDPPTGPMTLGEVQGWCVQVFEKGRFIWTKAQAQQATKDVLAANWRGA